MNNGGTSIPSCRSNTAQRVDAKESEHNKAADNDLRSKNNACGQIEAECCEQNEPGVHLTLVSLQDGTRDLTRVRFRWHYILAPFIFLLELFICDEVVF